MHPRLGLAQRLKASLSPGGNGVAYSPYADQAKAKGDCDPHSSGPNLHRKNVLPEELFREKSYGPAAGNQEANAKGKPFVTLPAYQIRKKQKELEDRALIGLLAGPRPPVETLRNWIRSQWGPLEAEVETIQALPKGHYLFMFKNADMAFSVLSHGQWVIRSSPLSLFRWNKDVNAERSALVNYPVWVEFPNLPMHYHSHLAEIGSSLGKVLGGRQKSNYVPSWHPQVLIEMDISVELPAAIDIFTDDGELFEQGVAYKYLTNTCFHCGDRSHFVRNCPIKFPPAPQPNLTSKATQAKEKDAEGFTMVSHNKGKSTANRADKGKEKMKGRSWQPNRLASLNGFEESPFMDSDVSKSEAEATPPADLEGQFIKQKVTDVNIYYLRNEVSKDSKKIFQELDEEEQEMPMNRWKMKENCRMMQENKDAREAALENINKAREFMRKIQEMIDSLKAMGVV
ncbi:hypothetical protein L7F22_023243 [Adiantum nelumboides]|nr:hypothetical protein [Adiantum nelumboides]